MVVEWRITARWLVSSAALMLLAAWLLGGSRSPTRVASIPDTARQQTTSPGRSADAAGTTVSSGGDWVRGVARPQTNPASAWRASALSDRGVAATSFKTSISWPPESDQPSAVEDLSTFGQGDQNTSSSTLGQAVPPTIRQWESLILRYASRYQVDPALVAAIIMTESGGNPNATSPRGAVGLMQVLDGPYDPDANVNAGVQILSDDLQHFNGDLELALAAYNAGASSVNRYQGIPPYLETENYVFEVLNRYYLYSSG